MADHLFGTKPYIWISIGLLIIGPIGENFSEILIVI